MKILNRLHLYSFYLFLVTWPLSVRKVLYYVPINGKFNEYTSISIYISDVFLFATALFWLLSSLCNIYSFLSINSAASPLNCSTWNNLKKLKNLSLDNVPRGTFFFKIKKLFHVEQFKNNTQLIHRIKTLTPLMLIAFLFISSLNTKAPILGAANTFIILKLIFIIAYFRKNVPRGTFFLHLLWITSITGLTHSIFAITQFINQESLGLTLLKESIININMPGVAKVPIGENLLVRAYGLFPHPNILGGVLLFSFVATFLLFHVEQFNKNEKANCSTWNNLIRSLISRRVQKQIVPRGTICFDWKLTLLKAILLILSLGIIASFSKTAMSGLIIFISLCYFVPRGTFFKKQLNMKLFHVEQFQKLFILISFIILATLTITGISTTKKSLYERELYQNVSRGTFFDNPLIGTGLGQSLLHMPANYEPWQYQPVHNVPMLALTEVGLIGTILLIFTIITNIIVPRGTIMKNVKTHNRAELSEEIVPRGTISDKTLRLILFFGIISFIPALLFDHYIWDINQGRVIFAFLLGML